MRKDYYRILGLPDGSDEAAIRKAYRSLAKQFHPDVNSSVTAREKFIEINEAYSYLIDPAKRNSHTVGEWKHAEYETDEYKRIRDELRAKAREKAERIAEQSRKRFLEFQKSGLHDLAIIGRYFFRLILYLIPLVFLSNVGYSVFKGDLPMFIVNFFLFVFTGLIAWLVIRNWSYLFPKREFYYNQKRIRDLLLNNSGMDDCKFSVGRKSGSLPYTIEIIKLKDIKLEFKGFRQQKVNYKFDIKKIILPRSGTAFMLHSVIVAIKIFTILGFIVFVNWDSILWRMIAGIMVSEVISQLLSFFSGVKLPNTYFYNWSTSFKLIVWLFFIVLFTDFKFHPLDISVSPYIKLVIGLLLIADSFLEQFLYWVFGYKGQLSFFKQPVELNNAIKAGYKLYNDTPVFSFLYPFWKWIVG